jgi:hypothetical protein
LDQLLKIHPPSSLHLLKQFLACLQNNEDAVLQSHIGRINQYMYSWFRSRDEEMIQLMFSWFSHFHGYPLTKYIEEYGWDDAFYLIQTPSSPDQLATLLGLIFQLIKTSEHHKHRFELHDGKTLVSKLMKRFFRYPHVLQVMQQMNQFLKPLPPQRKVKEIRSSYGRPSATAKLSTEKSKDGTLEAANTKELDEKKSENKDSLVTDKGVDESKAEAEGKGDVKSKEDSKLKYKPSQQTMVEIPRKKASRSLRYPSPEPRSRKPPPSTADLELKEDNAVKSSTSKVRVPSVDPSKPLPVVMEDPVEENKQSSNSQEQPIVGSPQQEVGSEPIHSLNDQSAPGIHSPQEAPMNSVSLESIGPPNNIAEVEEATPQTKKELEKVKEIIPVIVISHRCKELLGMIPTDRPWFPPLLLFLVDVLCVHDAMLCLDTLMHHLRLNLEKWTHFETEADENNPIDRNIGYCLSCLYALLTNLSIQADPIPDHLVVPRRGTIRRSSVAPSSSAHSNLKITVPPHIKPIVLTYPNFMKCLGKPSPNYMEAADVNLPPLYHVPRIGDEPPRSHASIVHHEQIKFKLLELGFLKLLQQCMESYDSHVLEETIKCIQVYSVDPYTAKQLLCVPDPKRTVCNGVVQEIKPLDPEKEDLDQRDDLNRLYQDRLYGELGKRKNLPVLEKEPVPNPSETKSNKTGNEIKPRGRRGSMDHTRSPLELMKRQLQTSHEEMLKASNGSLQSEIESPYFLDSLHLVRHSGNRTIQRTARAAFWSLCQFSSNSTKHYAKELFRNSIWEKIL